MEAKSWSEEHESHQAYNGDECAKQHEVIRGCGMKLLYVNVADIWKERPYPGRSHDGEILVIMNHGKSAEVVVAKKWL